MQIPRRPDRLHRQNPSIAVPARLLAAVVLAVVGGRAPAQQQFAELGKHHLPHDSEGTAAVVFGDVDGDGDLDLVVGNRSQDLLYLNDGIGAYRDSTSSRMETDGYGTMALAIGDVDGDGDVDIVSGGTNRSRLLANLQRQLDAPCALRAGRPYTLEAYVRCGPPSQFDVAMAWLSTTRLSIAVPPYGTLGIDPMVALLPIWIAQPAGVGGTTWQVPNLPVFAGTSVFAQAAFLHWPTDIRLSNVTADVLLR